MAPLHLNFIACFQHDGAQTELTDAQNQMESIKEKVKTKDAYIVELQEKIEKHQVEASEARKIEQVSHFQLNLSHLFSPGTIKFGHHLFMVCAESPVCIARKFYCRNANIRRIH